MPPLLYPSMYVGRQCRSCKRNWNDILATPNRDLSRDTLHMLCYDLFCCVMICILCIAIPGCPMFNVQCSMTTEAKAPLSLSLWLPHLPRRSRVCIFQSSSHLPYPRPALSSFFVAFFFSFSSIPLPLSSTKISKSPSLSLAHLRLNFTTHPSIAIQINVTRVVYYLPLIYHQEIQAHTTSANILQFCAKLSPPSIGIVPALTTACLVEPADDFSSLLTGRKDGLQFQLSGHESLCRRRCVALWEDL